MISPLGAQRGFTMVELIIVVAIIGILAFLAFPAFNAMKISAKTARCLEEIRGLEKDINAYVIDHGGQLPPELADIGRADLLDPWGNHYEYYNIVEKGVAGAYRKIDGTAANISPDGASYDLYSKGPDGDTTKSLAGVPMDPASADDIVRGEDGGFIGTGAEYGLP